MQCSIICVITYERSGITHDSMLLIMFSSASLLNYAKHQQYMHEEESYEESSQQSIICHRLLLYTGPVLLMSALPLGLAGLAFTLIVCDGGIQNFSLAGSPKY
jgi:hypothetical protein